MIAVSDAVLITVSAAALVTGVLRWQGNVEVATGVQRPALVAAEIQQPINGGSNSLPTGLLAGNQTSVQALADTNAGESGLPSSSSRVVVVEEQQTALIDITTGVQTSQGNQATADATVYGNYTVQSGDSLSIIAERYSTTVQTLQQLNGISGSLINVGQQIRYPEPVN